MRVLKRNAIRCKLCGDVIESKSIHDWVECSCKSCFVDGGCSYARIGGNLDDIEMLQEYEDVPGYFVTRYDIFGNSYTFETDNPNRLIEYYENNDYYLIVEDDEHNEIYRTNGLNRILNAVNNNDTLIREGENGED